MRLSSARRWQLATIAGIPIGDSGTGQDGHVTRALRRWARPSKRRVDWDGSLSQQCITAECPWGCRGWAVQEGFVHLILSIRFMPDFVA